MTKSIALILALAFLATCTTIHPYYTTPQLDRNALEKPPEPKPSPRSYLNDYILFMLLTDSLHHRGTPYLSPLSYWDMERIFLLHSLIMNEILIGPMLMEGLDGK